MLIDAGGTDAWLDLVVTTSGSTVNFKTEDDGITGYGLRQSGSKINLTNTAQYPIKAIDIYAEPIPANDDEENNG